LSTTEKEKTPPLFGRHSSRYYVNSLRYYVILMISILMVKVADDNFVEPVYHLDHADQAKAGEEANGAAWNQFRELNALIFTGCDVVGTWS
jgi:hypothetical protein